MQAVRSSYELAYEGVEGFLFTYCRCFVRLIFEFLNCDKKVIIAGISEGATRPNANSKEFSIIKKYFIIAIASCSRHVTV